MTSVDQTIFKALAGRREALGNPTDDEIREALKITQNQ